MFQDILGDIGKLKKGKLYTYVGMSISGSPFMDRIRLNHIKYEPFENYQDSYLIVGQDNGRWRKFYRLHEKKQFIIWENAVAANVDPIVHMGGIDYVEGGYIQVAKRWPYHDPRYMHRALTSCLIKPVVAHVFPITKPETLIVSHVLS